MMSKIKLFLARQPAPVAATEKVTAEQGFHTLDSPQAAAAFGAQIQNLCQSTQPKVSVPLAYVQATVSLGLALSALADLLA